MGPLNNSVTTDIRRLFMMAVLRTHVPDRRTLLLIGGMAAPLGALLVFAIWIIRQDSELAEKRANDEKARIASLAGQELSAHLETAALRVAAGGVTPGDG